MSMRPVQRPTDAGSRLDYALAVGKLNSMRKPPAPEQTVDFEGYAAKAMQGGVASWPVILPPVPASLISGSLLLDSFRAMKVTDLSPKGEAAYAAMNSMNRMIVANFDSNGDEGVTVEEAAAFLVRQLFDAMYAVATKGRSCAPALFVLMMERCGFYESQFPTSMAGLTEKTRELEPHFRVTEPPFESGSEAPLSTVVLPPVNPETFGLFEQLRHLTLTYAVLSVEYAKASRGKPIPGTFKHDGTSVARSLAKEYKATAMAARREFDTFFAGVVQNIYEVVDMNTGPSAFPVSVVAAKVQTTLDDIKAKADKPKADPRYSELYAAFEKLSTEALTRS